MQCFSKRTKGKLYSTINGVLIVMTIRKWYVNERRNASRKALCTLLLRSRTHALVYVGGLNLYLLCIPRETMHFYCVDGV